MKLVDKLKSLFNKKEMHVCNCGHHHEEKHECNCNGECGGNCKCKQESEMEYEFILDEVELEDIVYVNMGSSSSDKYHSSEHAHNMEGAVAMAKTEAIAQGFVPCSKCFKDQFNKEEN